MANKRRGYVEIELDKKRKLRYDFNAMCELEDALGRSLQEMNDKNVRMKDMRAMLWAGLIHEDPDLDIVEAGNLIDEAESLQYVAEKVAEAIELSQGSNKKKTAKTKKKVTPN